MNITVIAFRNLSRNRRRSVLSLSAIAIVAIVIVFMMGLINWMKTDIRHNITTYIAGDLRIRNENFIEEEDGNPLEYLVENSQGLQRLIESHPQVTATSPRLHLGTAMYRDGKTVPAIGMAVDFQREETFMNFSSYLVKGHIPPSDSREAIFSAPLADKLQLSVGDRITLMLMTRRRSSNAVTLTVSGIADFSGVNVNQETFFAPLELMQRITHSGDAIMELLIRTDVEDSNLDELASISADIHTMLETEQYQGLEVSSWNQASDFWSLMRLADLSYGIMAAVFFLLGSTVIINTTIMTIYERQREIGTLAALGMESRDIVTLFFTEATLLGIIGAFVGVVLGYVLSIPIMQFGIPLYDSFMSEFGTEFSSRLYILVQPATLLYVFLFAVIVSSAASYLPARKSSRIKPVDALKNE